jgi:uncharacterized protein (TIGR00251 family)
MESSALRQTSEGVVLTLKAVPGARANQVRYCGSELRVLVTQTAERGKANQAILALLADALGLAKTRIEIVRGTTGRRKTVLLRGCQLAEIKARLAQ